MDAHRLAIICAATGISNNGVRAKRAIVEDGLSRPDVDVAIAPLRMTNWGNVDVVLASPPIVQRNVSIVFRKLVAWRRRVGSLAGRVLNGRHHGLGDLGVSTKHSA